MRNVLLVVLCATTVVMTSAGASADDGRDPVVLADTEVATVTREVTVSGAVVTKVDHHTELGGPIQVRTYPGRSSFEQGERACVFTGESTSPPDTPEGVIYEEREIAFDETNCTLTTESGEALVPDVVRKGYVTENVETEPQVDGRGVPTLKDASKTPVLAPSASSSKSAFFKTYYEDAVKLDLNAVTARLKWTYNGSCVTASSNHTASYKWLTATHWQKDYSTVTSKRTCGEAYTRAVAHFSNPPGFLGCATTYTTHQPTKISGQENGYTRAWTVLVGSPGRSPVAV